jgi:hyperosmotically inducible periplasmic protein
MVEGTTRLSVRPSDPLGTPGQYLPGAGLYLKNRYIAFACIFTAVLTTAVFTTVIEVRGQENGFATDNSRQNAPQPNLAAPLTAQDQPNDKADRRTAAHVREAIVADRALSTYAHNVKVIVADGKVTLEGPVYSDAERQQLIGDVTTVVGPNLIVNRITVV